MLHDAIASRLSRAATSHDDRRCAPRVPYPAEMTISWHHEMPTTMRYDILDVSDTGFRIRSSTPLLQGMTGTALRLLPEGREINHAVMVAWVRRCDDQGTDVAGDSLESAESHAAVYEIGLRRF